MEYVFGFMYQLPSFWWVCRTFTVQVFPGEVGSEVRSVGRGREGWYGCRMKGRGGGGRGREGWRSTAVLGGGVT